MKHFCNLIVLLYRKTIYLKTKILKRYKMNKYSNAIEMIKDINIIDLKNIIKNVYNIEADFDLKDNSDSFQIISNDYLVRLVQLVHKYLLK
jgi:hypothetical protein